MQPGSDDHAAHAVAQHLHILDSDAVRSGHVAHERIGVFDEVMEMPRMAACARGAPVTAGVPGEYGDVFERQALH